MRQPFSKRKDSQAQAQSQAPASSPASVEFATALDPYQTFKSDTNGWKVSSDSHLADPSRHRFGKVKKLVLQSSKTLGSIFERAHVMDGKGRKERQPYNERAMVRNEHSPRVIYGHAPTEAGTFVEKSKSLSNIALSIKSLNPLQKAPRVPTSRALSDREKIPVYLTDEKLAKIGQWAAQQYAEYNEQVLVALTTAELKRLEGSTVDKFAIVKGEYNVPPPTPATSEVGDVEDDFEHILEGDFDPEARHEYLHKDLRKILVPYTGFHIAPGSGCASLFDAFDNFSDCYRLPLIEYASNPGRDIIDGKNEEEEEEGYSSSLATSQSSDYDQEENHLQRPRSQVPAQAIIQYLIYKGIPLANVAQKLGPLDVKFLYQSESRWWKNTRIPEHTQLNDKVIAKVLEITMAEEQWWEKEFDLDGRRMPTAMRTIQTRMRETDVKKLAKKSLENYFWWRLRGETVHLELKRGPALRKGEY